MNRAILTDEVQRFIREHSGKDIDRLLFAKSPFAGVTSRELAEQIESRLKCEKKLPTWFSTPAIYYPPKISVEQASSELTADYKSRLLAPGSTVDLTGGMGVDARFFARHADRVFHIEQSAELSEIAAYNAGRLNVDKGEFVCSEGIDYLSGTMQTFDNVYCDPSRRSGSAKVFKLKDCQPDVTQYLDLFLRKASRTLIKTSPLLDLQAGLSELRQVSDIHVVSVKNDCKELVWICSPGSNGEPLVTCTALDGQSEKQFTFLPSDEAAAIIERYSARLHTCTSLTARFLKPAVSSLSRSDTVLRSSNAIATCILPTRLWKTSRDACSA